VSENLVIQSHQGPYTVVFGDAIARHLDTIDPDKAHFIVDRRVFGLHAAALERLKNTSLLLLEANEQSKSLERFPDYVEHLVSRRARRDHTLVAIGGGVIQDITSFLAATLLRGIPWRFFPTTLLAQADSCIGSKSSVNCGSAKNILGTFTPPREVVISSQFLETLDNAALRSGIGEMLKAHAIDSPAAFDRIAGDYGKLLSDKEVMKAYLRRSLEIKHRYIEVDEFDRGPRLIFNYGHSFGHALEAATDFAIPHGIAVTIGMDMANYVAMRKERTDQSLYRHRHGVLRENFRGYEKHPVSLEPFLAAMAKDKKNEGRDKVTVILPNREHLLERVVLDAGAEFAAICGEYLETARPN